MANVSIALWAFFFGSLPQKREQDFPAACLVFLEEAWMVLHPAVFFAVVKRRESVCQAFLLNDTKLMERSISNGRVGDHGLCWNEEQQCPVLWPSKSCSPPGSWAEGNYVQSIPVFLIRNWCFTVSLVLQLCGLYLVYEGVLKLPNVFWGASRDFKAITWIFVKQLFHKPVSRHRSSCFLEVCLRFLKLWQPLAPRVRVISWGVRCLGFPELWNWRYIALSWAEICLLRREE